MSAPEPYWHDADFTVYAGDCLDVLRGLPDNSVDAVVTDPPAGIAFMNKKWDGDKGGREQWSAWLAEVMRECLRVAKPGAHAVVWALPRTSHWTACGLEDAGWDIRDRISHIFATGFPKSLDISKAIDRAAGAEREIVGDKLDRPGYHLHGHDSGTGAFGRGISSTTPESRFTAAQITAPATDGARRWQGWGTALKPAAEDWWVARKPLAGTVAGNVTTWGTGALNIAGCRVGTDGGTRDPGFDSSSPESVSAYGNGLNGRSIEPVPGLGRWPSNVVLTHAVGWDGTDLCAGPDGCVPGCPVAELDRQSGHSTTPTTVTRGGSRTGNSGLAGLGRQDEVPAYGDSGGGSRFFPVFRYEAKAPASQRPRVWEPACNCETIKPCEGTSQPRDTGDSGSADETSWSTSTSGSNTPAKPSHPDTTSTTETATSSTTTSPTSSSSPRSNTSASTADANSETANGGSPAASASRCFPSTSSTSTSPPRDGRSTAGAAPATSARSSRPSVCESCGEPYRPSSHATVKPLDLMRWLVRLVTPPGGTVLDPFAGSGTTAEACLIERFRCITIERDPDYLPLIRARLSKPIQPTLGLGDF